MHDYPTNLRALDRFCWSAPGSWNRAHGTVPPAPDPLRDLAAWLEDYRRYWDDRLDNLDAYLKTIQPKGDKS